MHLRRLNSCTSSSTEMDGLIVDRRVSETVAFDINYMRVHWKDSRAYLRRRRRTLKD